MNRLLLYSRTLAHLRVQQILALVRRRVLPARTVIPDFKDIQLRKGAGLDACISMSHISSDDFAFSFLNHTREFPEGKVDWTSKDMTKLWRYNLHYFDYLLDTKRSSKAKACLISDWIDKNPVGSGDGWEPYSVSLRIVNWIKYFLGSEGLLPEDWVRSLYQQTFWLERNLETHILANHYLKNGVALFYAGMYFRGHDAEGWLSTARQILHSQLDEQFLSDGGHYERSPMYHAISMVDYLDVLNLLYNSQSDIQYEETQRVETRIRTALQFLSDLCLPDGTIPLFNDAALRIAPHQTEIISYAHRIFGYVPQHCHSALAIKAKSQTGYYVIREGLDMMVIDCGPVGPDYQPGHAHADTLSFELALDGSRVVVDTGVYDYEPGPRRTYARSTRAHNTVCVDDLDQSEVWGVFRVARRAYPLRASLTSDRPGHAVFLGAHDGYRRLPGQVIHERMIEYSSPGRWTIQDTLLGKGLHKIESYLHLHPDLEPRVGASLIEVGDRNGKAVMTVEPSANVIVTIHSGFYFPEFGKEVPNKIIVMAYCGHVPVTLTYRIIKVIATHGGTFRHC